MSATEEQQAQAVLAQADVEFAYLFGSRAKGTHGETSDLDIAVMAGREMGLYERAGLANQLAEVLGVPDIDLILLDAVRLPLRGRVVQEGRLIYECDKARRVAFEVRTRSVYFDFLPTYLTHVDRYIHQVAERGL